LRQPQRTLNASTGWVGAQHANVKQEREAKREQQEARDRGARRRVLISPRQPQPVGHGQLEETLNALLGDQ
jgi:hypothetical protein